MLDFLRGQKESISKLCGGLELELELYHKAPMEIDVCCFGLDDSGQLSDEQYFIFYNQVQSPEGAVVQGSGPATGATRFQLHLEKLPPHIAKLSFTASIDGTRTMKEMSKGYVRLLKGEQEVGRFAYNGTDFTVERAIVVCEVYRRGKDWRFGAVGRGFHGGLKALVESFGGMVAQQGAQSPPTTAKRTIKKTSQAKTGPIPVRDIVSALPEHVCVRMDGLARQCRGDTAYLSSLYKNMFASLAQYPNVAATSVQVVMCADVSGSMYDMYHCGRVQRALDKFFAFATTLAEGCTMDFWAFGAKSRQFGAVTMDNVRDYTFAEAGGFERWMSMLNYQYNNEPEAMRDIMMIYGARNKPVMVLFLTDGRMNADWEVEEILIKTSRFPVFWQYIGIHGEEYGILDRLHEVDGRYTSNAAFLKTDDIDDMTDQAFYDILLQNLTQWLQEISEKKLIEK